MQRQKNLLYMFSLALGITSIANIPAQAGTIAITYSLTGGPTGPPVVNGTSLTLDGLFAGSFVTGTPALDAIWNPVMVTDHSVIDLNTGLLNGTFKFTFADGDMLSGNLFENVSALLASGGTGGTFTQTYTVTGGTGMLTGASGSISGLGVAAPASTTTSGRGTLSAPGISSVPEPASVALMFGGLLVMVAKRKFVRDTRVYKGEE